MSVFRITPNMPVGAYTTYGMAFRRRPATCAEVNCAAWKNGWKTVVPAVGMQADYLRARQHGRHFAETRLPGGLAEFVFPPGQECFGSRHQVPVAVVPSLRGGDWRGATTPLRTVGVIEWRDRLQENQSAIADRIQRG